MFFAASYIAVGHVGFVFYGHHGYAGIDLGRKGKEDFVFVAVNAGWRRLAKTDVLERARSNIPNAHAFFYIRRTDSLTEFDNEFCDLFYIDNVFALFGVLFILDDLCTSRDL